MQLVMTKLFAISFRVYEVEQLKGCKYHDIGRKISTQDDLYRFVEQQHTCI